LNVTAKPIVRTAAARTDGSASEAHPKASVAKRILNSRCQIQKSLKFNLIKLNIVNLLYTHHTGRHSKIMDPMVAKAAQASALNGVMIAVCCKTSAIPWRKICVHNSTASSREIICSIVVKHSVKLKR